MAPRIQPEQATWPGVGYRTGRVLSQRAFEAAARLAKPENAMIMPVLLARVPRQLPLDAQVPAASMDGMPLLGAIEQRAAAEGIEAK
jgi:hypothetical protein